MTDTERSASHTPGPETFDDFRGLPQPIQAHLVELEDFIGDLDGKTTVEDDGVIYAEAAVRAVNAVAAEVSRLRALVESECRRAEDAHGMSQRQGLEIDRLRALKAELVAVLTPLVVTMGRHSELLRYQARSSTSGVACDLLEQTKCLETMLDAARAALAKAQEHGK